MPAAIAIMGISKFVTVL